MLTRKAAGNPPMLIDRRFKAGFLAILVLIWPVVGLIGWLA